MDPLVEAIDCLAAATGFSGVVRVDRSGEPSLARAYGFASRAYGVANTLDTRFGLASGTKGITALVVMSLIEEGLLSLDTAARSVVGGDLPCVDDAVTVEHLLCHRSGVGDYVDESKLESATDYVLTMPVHRLEATEDYVEALDGRPHAFGPGERFEYNNSGYVLLALIAERVAETPFPALVQARVCDRAGMSDTAFLRSDEPAGDVALGYLDRLGPRTNVLHLPVCGSGDGGIYSTAADVRAFWTAAFSGRVVELATLAGMLVSRNDTSPYGLGFWLDAESDTVMLEGSDAGVSFRSRHDPVTNSTHTVLSNTTEGAWPIAEHLEEHLGW